MAREIAAVELNQFNAGLVTDASPLTSPDNTSLEEENMELNSDGSRNRRLGMDFEQNYQVVNTSIPSSTENVAHSSFSWKNAGGQSDRVISVIQFANQLRFFDLSSRPISGNLIHTQSLAGVSVSSRVSYASVDGMLIVVSSDVKQPFLFRIFANNSITLSRQTLQIRDLFGVEAVASSPGGVWSGDIDLYSSTGLQHRPNNFPVLGNWQQRHVYNLRNQTWGISRVTPAGWSGGSGVVRDPISMFRAESGNRFPSNSDTVIQALFADPGIEGGDRTIERFHPREVFRNPIGSTKAAQGYFIIDALERGDSRLSRISTNQANYPALEWNVTSLPVDRTPGGAGVVTEFAGRVWYSGFSGEVVGGDARSPEMSSYILFSKLVTNPSDITECYQEGDPTGKEFPDVVDTDGGFIRLNNAYGIKQMVNLGDSLIILCENGIWRISGTSDNGFTATTYRVEKISDRGCINTNSVVVVDNTITYWSEDGIYNIATNEVGDWISASITVNKIQRLYESISEDSRRNCVGAFDPYQRKVRWIYDNQIDNDEETKELILDVVLQAFYLNRIKSTGVGGPKVVSILNTVPWTIDYSQDNITVNNELVTVNGEPVYLEYENRLDVARGEVTYITSISSGNNITFTFSNYTDLNFVDWRSYDGVGIDAEAFLVTSYLSGTDFQRGKQVPYITIHMRRTEAGYNEAMQPLFQSSCIVQSRWDWSNNNRANKWGREFQAYRYRRPYVPTGPNDPHDDGFVTVVTKNKLRGSGKVLSLRFRTEPGKDLVLYGWSMLFSVAGSV